MHAVDMQPGEPTVTGHDGTMTRDGITTWYRMFGDPADLTDPAAVPVVVCHGGPGATHDYLEPLAALARPGRPVVLYDQVGNGRSTHRPDAPAGSWTVELFLAELVALVEHLGLDDGYHLLGHSWGGQLALELAARRPHGLRSLVLAGTPASAALWISEARRLIAGLPEPLRTAAEGAEPGSPEHAALAGAYFRTHVCRLPEPPEPLARTMAAIESAPTVYATMVGTSEFEVTGTLRDWDITGRLDEIAVPALLLSGEHDSATPAVVEQVRAGLPDASWVTVPGAGHMAHLDRPDVVGAVVARFLDDVDSRRRTPVARPAPDARRDMLAGQLFGALAGGLELLTVEIGRRLGLYVAVHERHAVTARGLAEAVGVDARYAREWLEQQAACGILDVLAESDEPGRRAFGLPAAHADVLLVPTDPAYLAPAAGYLPALAAALDQVVTAFRDGGGVPFAAYPAFGQAIAELNGALYHNFLATWLVAMPDVAARLAAGGRVLDLGCGHGAAALALARGFPTVEIVGVDVDAEAITAARAAAAVAGLADRVRFVHGDAATVGAEELGDQFDLVALLETLHDLPDPVAVLDAARAVLAPTGVVLVADEKVDEAFAGPADDVERICYALSVLHCLPVTRHGGAVVDAGTVLRPPTVADHARAAGFAAPEVLAIDNAFWRFYRLSVQNRTT